MSSAPATKAAGLDGLKFLGRLHARRYGHLYEDRGDEAEALDALLTSARARAATPLRRDI